MRARRESAVSSRRQKHQVVQIGAGQAQRLAFFHEQKAPLGQFHAAVAAVASLAHLVEDHQVRGFGRSSAAFLVLRSDNSAGM